MNQYSIDLQFTSPELDDAEVTEWLSLNELFGEDQSWADRIDVLPWDSIEVRTSLNLDELRAQLAQVLNRYAKKKRMAVGRIRPRCDGERYLDD